MNKYLRNIIFLIIAGVISSIVKIDFDDYFIGTVYTVSGIMFSIGIGLVVTFNFHGAKNLSYILDIRKNLKAVRNSYIGYFAVANVSFLVDKFIRAKELCTGIRITDTVCINFNCPIFFLIIIFFTIIYYIINFLAIQGLNDELYDRVNGVK